MFPAGPPASFATTWRWMQRPLELLDHCAARYGDTFTLRFPSLPSLVMFSRPEDVREIFADDGDGMHAGEFNLQLRAFLGEHSVLMLDGKEHLRHRKLLLPPFHGERMQAYGQTMLDTADDAIDAWPVGRAFPIHGPMQAVTLKVILRTIFGMESAAGLARYEEVLTDLLRIASWPPLLLPVMQKDLGPWSPWGRFLRKQRESDDIVFSQIRARRAEGSRARTDILSLLIDARDEEGRPMSDEELHDELGTLLVAGHETTATALAWTFRWLLGTPHVTARLRDELAHAEAQGPLTPERIAKLELVDAVAREALRLSPVIPLVGRILKRPMRVGGFDLPAGAGVLCSIYLAQRRHAAFPHPATFDPDRFVGKKVSPNEFFPFGGGVRRCIGMAFALYEMKMVIARVVARTTLALASGGPIGVSRRSITLTPTKGLSVRLVERRPRAPSPAPAVRAASTAA